MQTIYKVLGVNDDRDFCECCGRTGLKKVVWIENTETGKVQHFGVVCASNPAKAFGLNSEIKRAEASFKAAQQAVFGKAHKAYKALGGKYQSLTAWSWEVIDKTLFAECVKTVKAA